MTDQVLLMIDQAVYRFTPKSGRIEFTSPKRDMLCLLQIKGRMQPSQRLQSYRKQIRKEHLDSFFAAKRIKLLQDLKASDHAMDLQKDKDELTYCDPESLTAEELKRMAKLSQSEAGIETIHKAQLEPHLSKYLSQQFCDSEQQYYASYIMCNLYYLTVGAPGEALTADVMRLLDQADMRTLQNLFFFLNNVISNYPSWLSLLINSHHFLDRLANLFKRFQKPTLSYLNYLLQIIFKCLQRASKDQGFLKLRLPVLKLLLQKESKEMKELIRKAAYCYYLLVRNFPAQVTPNIAKFGILPKLIELTAFFSQKKYTYLVLEIIELSLHELSQENVQNLVVPFLVKLFCVGFQLGDQSLSLQPRQLKMQGYRLLKQLLQSYKLSVAYFGSLKLGEMLLEEFQTSEDKQILAELAYIFVQVCLNSDNPQLKATIGLLIKRAQLFNKDDFQFNAYLHQFCSPL